VASVGSERAAADGHAGASASVAPAVRERWPFWVPVGILIVGLLVTGTLALVSNSLCVNNEKRLLDLRVREVGSVLAGAQPGVQTPLASAAALANATNGDVPKFRRFITPYVGVSPGHQFVSVSLWRLGVASARSDSRGGRPAGAQRIGVRCAHFLHARESEPARRCAVRTPGPRGRGRSRPSHRRSSSPRVRCQTPNPRTGQSAQPSRSAEALYHVVARRPAVRCWKPNVSLGSRPRPRGRRRSPACGNRPAGQVE
jgi:hypothetical protein